MGDGLPASVLGLPRATIEQAASAATIVLLSGDIKEELPVLYLRLRKAAESRRSRIIEFAPRETGLTRNAWKHVSYEPGSQAAEVLGKPDARPHFDITFFRQNPAQRWHYFPTMRPGDTLIFSAFDPHADTQIGRAHV